MDGFMKHLRHSISSGEKSVPPAAIIPVFMLSILMVMAGCDQTGMFDDVEGYNFLMHADFDNGPWITNAETDDPLPYLVFEEASVESADSTGLPGSGAPVYKLELINLFPNGDFEDPTASAADYWTPAGGIANAYAITTHPTDPADSPYEYSSTLGNALYYDFPTGTTLQFDLRDPTYGLTDGFLDNETYLFKFMFRTSNRVQSAQFEYSDGTLDNRYPVWDVNVIDDTSWVLRYFPLILPDYDTDTDTDTDADDDDTVDGGLAGYKIEPESYPQITADPERTAHSFTLGHLEGGQQQIAYIDNIRVSRTSKDTWLTLEVPAEGPNPVLGPHSLEDGYYAFSVYVRYAGSDFVTPNMLNTFDATGLTLGIAFGWEDYEDSEWDGTPLRYTQSYELNETTCSRSEWTKFEFVTPESVQVSGTDSITLLIAPTRIEPIELPDEETEYPPNPDTSGTALSESETAQLERIRRSLYEFRDIGKILISTPELYFLPDGPPAE